MSNKFKDYKEIENLINNTLNVRTISELLICFEQTENVEAIKKYIIDNRFDLVGVKHDGCVVGYTDLKTLEKSDLEVIYSEFKPSDIISSSTPLLETVTLLNQKDQLFVLDGSMITRIVTKADIYKEPVRLFLYNLISNFETLLSILIEHNYPNLEWKSKLNDKSLERLDMVYESRKRENTEFDLFDCLPLENKIDLFLNKDKRLKDILGLSSTKQKDYFKDLKTIRNALSHVGKNPAITNIEKILSIITDTTAFSQILADKISKLEDSNSNAFA